jgi:hypothetical protein
LEYQDKQRDGTEKGKDGWRNGGEPGWTERGGGVEPTHDKKNPRRRRQIYQRLRRATKIRSSE